MKTYIYTYKQGRRDVNGNPHNYVTVYRLKKNVPVRVGKANQLIGYRDIEQAVCDVILDNEKGWGKRYNSKHGSENPVNDAVKNARYKDNPVGKVAQLFRV
jgi:hypothetical protein